MKARIAPGLLSSEWVRLVLIVRGKNHQPGFEPEAPILGAVL